MVLDNDTRGWILALLSGLACVIGATVTCVDVLVRLLTRRKNFRIQDSNVFLSCSLSLSAGVMLFSALYSMLPSSRTSLEEGHLSSKAAAWTLVGCFIGGAAGIQVLSRVLHRSLPSHIVDCDHSHDDEDATKEAGDHGHVGRNKQKSCSTNRSNSQAQENSETTPLLSMSAPVPESLQRCASAPGNSEEPDSRHAMSQIMPRPTLPQRLNTSVSQLISRSKSSCDQDGPCYGYTDVCGQDCFKRVQSRDGAKLAASRRTRHPGVARSVSLQDAQGSAMPDFDYSASKILAHAEPRTPSDSHIADLRRGRPRPDALDQPNSSIDSSGKDQSTSSTEAAKDASQSHHHHIPRNPFLSIGLQVPIAIALHKLPEGFITYATNHANPRLGSAVFLALFIHNITEGFAMALPLYLALNSRIKALLWTLLLGGFSQPLGAGIAALWFKLAGNADSAPGEGMYGGMFAVTAGIMASVGLQLYAESLDLTHNKRLCLVFVFIGMGILGVSSALTA